MESLVLNTAAIPVSIIPARRAVTLVVLSRAIALRNYGEYVHSARYSLPIPAVIQCIASDYMPKKYTKTMPFSRKNVYIRDGGRCMYCGKKVSLSNMTFDHVIPRCDGGKTNWENIVISCMRCNLEKGRKSAKRFKRPLIRKPYAPQLSKAAPAYLVSKIASEIPHETWMDFIYWEVELIQD